MRAPLQIKTDTPPRAAVGRRKRRSPWPWAATAMGLALIGTAAAIEFTARRSADSATTSSRSAASSENTPVEAGKNAGMIEHPVANDPSGKLLWASPTSGPPFSLAYIPGGTQCLVHLRPAQILAHPEGDKLVAALGPWGKRAIDQLERVALAPLADVESLLASFVIADGGTLQAVWRIELSEALDADLLEVRLAGAQLKERGDQSYWVRDGRAYWLAAAGGQSAAGAQSIVVAPESLAAELLDAEGEPPPLVRDVDALAARSDYDRAATIIIAPRLLQASGHQLLVAEAAPVREALEWLTGHDAGALAISVHWDDSFFMEVRATPTLNVPPHRLAAELRERVRAAPDTIEGILSSNPWHPYGRRVLERLPAMLRAAAHYTRSGEEDRQALVRCYLPSIAGHNLLMAGELLLTQSNSDEELASGDGGRSSAPAAQEELLAAETSLSFTKDTLERAVELLAEDTGVSITIAGGDLQLEGITKNQTFGIDLRRRPAADILVEILRQANPDRGASGPADPRQKLVYVVEQPAAGRPGRIIVTTRTAAERRGEQIAPPFLGNDR